MTSQDHDAAVRTGCLGWAPPGREVVIVDDAGAPVPRGELGELPIRDASLMHGYFRGPEATKRAFREGRFRTGDPARMDDDGRVYYSGRTKDMIRRSGENIAAAEIERVCTYTPVEVAAVLPEPDELRGEEVHAVVLAATNRAVHVSWRISAPSSSPTFEVPRYWTFRGTAADDGLGTRCQGHPAVRTRNRRPRQHLPPRSSIAAPPRPLRAFVRICPLPTRLDHPAYICLSARRAARARTRTRQNVSVLAGPGPRHREG